jgi:hypothetical protein
MATLLTTHQETDCERSRTMLEKSLHQIVVGCTPYLDVVDMRNAFVRIRSLEHPNEYVDIYKSTLTRLADALLKTEREVGTPPQ